MCFSENDVEIREVPALVLSEEGAELRVGEVRPHGVRIEAAGCARMTGTTAVRLHPGAHARSTRTAGNASDRFRSAPSPHRQATLDRPGSRDSGSPDPMPGCSDNPRAI